jgi:hypothetical protein
MALAESSEFVVGLERQVESLSAGTLGRSQESRETFQKVVRCNGRTLAALVR